jgi:hypothetical protein
MPYIRQSIPKAQEQAQLNRGLMQLELIAIYWLFKQAEDRQVPIFVPSLVVLETIRVLQSVYAITD